MLVSELIAELTKLQATVGDVPVVMRIGRADYVNDYCTVYNVQAATAANGDGAGKWLADFDSTSNGVQVAVVS